MELQVRSSQVVTSSTINEHKAWHCLPILLSLGRPVRAAELACNCTLFDSSPELVEHLCRIPNSPLTLTNDGFVMLSFAFLDALSRFMKNSDPRFTFVLSGPSKWGEDVDSLEGANALRPYPRKRKIRGDELVPIVKKRAILQFIGDNDDDKNVFGPRIKAWTNAFKAHDDLSVSVPASVLWRHISFSVAESVFNCVNFKDFEFNKPLVTPYKCQQRYIEYGKDKMMDLISTDADIRDSDQEDTEAEIISPNMSQNSLVVLALPCALKGDRQEMEIGTGIGAQNTQLCPEKDEPDHERQGESVMIPSHASDTEDSGKVRVVQQPIIDHDASKVDGLHLSPSLEIASIDTNVSTNRFTAEIQANKAPVCNMDPLSPHDTPGIQLRSRKIMKKKDGHQQKVQSKTKQALSKPPEQKKTVIVPESKNLEGSNTKSLKHHKKQQIRKNPEKLETCLGNSSKDHSDLTAFPKFEGFIVEEEEGSGGYGTVYRARSKTDGTIFAIKYPHSNAHKHHIDNEKRMLQRFGGRNFVIKYVGEFKSGSLDSFILEHVEHDRPDVLKKEIDIYQLRWYGFCMFKALVGLHKEGVVHRDVKPGNFLFSRKTGKGYLIDFNLARDLHQKQANTADKSHSLAASEQNHVSHRKATSPGKHRKVPPISKSSKPLLGESSSKVVNSSLEAKILKMKALCGAHKKPVPSQGADGSVITSTKDVTSNRTSGERLGEPPLLCKGLRRELNSMAQEAMQNPRHATPRVPACKRKRVAAPPNGMIGGKNVYYSPMPVHYSSGIAIPGSGFGKKKGDGKIQKEGPCAGTKGFRAPEVLIRSAHQGPKIDVWSAGVTLLYLMVGKAPFTGDPEQNMKDLVKLRGSEELWEVAKLHNRESSFPTDLLDVRFLQGMELTEWCMANTKRPEFLEAIPKSLFDLVDKCLTVNPRLRITAEEAVRHEFFAPCYDDLRKLRMNRQKSVLDEPEVGSNKQSTTAAAFRSFLA